MSNPPIANALIQDLMAQGFVDGKGKTTKDLSQDRLFKHLDGFLTHNPDALDEVLKLDFINGDALYDYLSKTHNIPINNLANANLNLQNHHKLDVDFLAQKYIVPLMEDDFTIQIASYNPYDQSLKYELMQRLGKNIILVLTRKEQLERYIQEIKINKDLQAIIKNVRINLKTTKQATPQEQSHTTQMLELILKKGVRSRASDIHLEHNNNTKEAFVRFRIDGLLYGRFEFDEEIYLALSSTLKLFANIDFVNNTKAQDGRFAYELEDEKFDFRVSVIPLFNGESISVRILQKKNFLTNLQDLGLSEHSIGILERVSHHPHGLILVTGPTGSGKTTTLYSTLSKINNTNKKIITVEDPVEYELSRIQQIQVKIRSDVNFSSILKSILRHDPDVIMIGEVRDNESLKIAVESALTGHLVFTTLHTNDAISSVIRLKEMGVEDYLIANALLAVHSQRLVRRLCSTCRKPHTPNENTLDQVACFLPKTYQFYQAKGCNECAMTGFSGRILISETLFVSQPIAAALGQSLEYDKLTTLARDHGFVPILEDGIQKALRGETSLGEVIRAVST